MSKRLVFFCALIALPLVVISCKKEKNPATPTPTNPTPEPMLVHKIDTVMLAYNTSTQTDPICFFDFDAGTSFSVSDAPANAASIDFVYVLRYAAANDPMFISIGNFDGQPGYPISSWNKTTLGIGTFATYNHTAMWNAPSAVTTASFDAMTKKSELTAAIGTGPAEGFDNVTIDPTKVGNIYQFRTQQGKLGLFKVLDSQNGSSGYAIIDIKMEQ